MSTKIESKESHNFLNGLLLSFLNFLKYLHSNLNRTNFVVLSEDLYISGLIVFICKLLKIPFIYRSSDYGIIYRRKLLSSLGINGKFLPFILSKFENLLINCSDFVIVPSMDSMNDMLNNGVSDKKICFFPHVSIPYTPHSTEISFLKKKLNLEGKTSIIFFGNMEYKPNLDSALFVIELSRQINKTFSDDDSIFILAGKNSCELKSYASKNLIILGEVENAQLLLSVCDIGLNPSSVPGGTSIKVIDYLVNGLHVISTKEGAYGIIKNERLIICKREKFLDNIMHLKSILKSELFDANQVPKVIKDIYMSESQIKSIAKKISSLYNIRTISKNRKRDN